MGCESVMPRNIHRFVMALICAGMCVAACGRNQTTWEYMPDMMDQVTVKTYEPDALSPDGKKVRLPVAGTVPRNFEAYPFAVEAGELAGRELVNPLPRTLEILQRGKKSYGYYCVPCHGVGGEGNGPVVPKFPQPPTLLSDKVHEWPDGRIFHVITRGQNLMPHYASQMAPDERWAVVHYVRVLQRAGKPTAEDVQKVLGQP